MTKGAVDSHSPPLWARTARYITKGPHTAGITHHAVRVKNSAISLSKKPRRLLLHHGVVHPSIVVSTQFPNLEDEGLIEIHNVFAFLAATV